MTINYEIFWSVLMALCTYGLGKYLLSVAVSHLFGGNSKAVVSQFGASTKRG